MSEAKFEGLKEITAKFDNLANVDKINAALGRACALVERSAKENAPKGNGELRRSITSKVENFQGIVFTPLEYAPYVEYGTGLFAEDGNGRTWDLPWAYEDEKGEWHTSSGQEPYPFMRPALDANRMEIIRILKEGVKK